nr:reverse transcriptase domain-containing protein [Tanacetum cinerariifolium]
MIDQGVNAALAARDANRTGGDNHTSRTGVRRTERWFEKMEMVFRISNCLAENQVKFATCTLLASALTWWNSHVRVVGNDAAYVMTWKELKKKIADKYCPRNEMKKIETELWNLEVQDTIMSDFEDSTVTDTTVSSPYEGRSRDVSPGVDGPPVMSEDPYSYVVAAFQALPSPDYVPGPEEPKQAPPSPVYIPYVPEPEYPEYIPPEDEVFPAKEQPLPAAASPTTDLPGYIPESDPKDDDNEDPADYPTDHDDDEEEEEPSGDDADEEDEEQDEDDDDEEEEHPASADSIPPLPVLRVTARISSRPQPPTLFFTKEDAERYEAGESSAAAAARPIEGRRADYGFVGSVEAEIRRRIAEDIGYGIKDTWIDPRDVAKEEVLMTLEGVNSRVTKLVAVQEQDTQDIYGVMEDTQGRQTEIFQRVEALVDDSQYHYETSRLVDQEAMFLERLGRIL